MDECVRERERESVGATDGISVSILAVSILGADK